VTDEVPEGKVAVDEVYCDKVVDKAMTDDNGADEAMVAATEHQALIMSVYLQKRTLYSTIDR
jgi:hypothetical protein